MKNELEIKVALQISKPAHEVFEAIADPEKMSNYFISKSSERMKEGKKLLWEFPEFEGNFPFGWTKWKRTNTFPIIGMMWTENPCWWK